MEASSSAAAEMEARRSWHLIFFLWAPLISIIEGVAAAAAAPNILAATPTLLMPTHPAIFVFGDSLSDTGNSVLSGITSALRTTQMPYGETFPGWPMCRHSNGHLLVDLLATHLGLPFLNPYLNSSADFGGGVNYAVAGATALNTSFLGSFGIDSTTNLSLDIQLSWHLDLQAKVQSSMIGNTAGSPTNAAFAEGLYVIEIGGNDYIHSYEAKYVPSFAISTLIPLVIQKIHDAVETLLSIGAKHFLFITISPLGCLSSMVAQFDGIKDANGCLEEYNLASYLHGAHVQEEVASLRVSYPNVSFLVMDFYGAYDFILKHNEMYGFSKTLEACCGAGDDYPYNYSPYIKCNVESVSVCANPNEYIIWDGIHFTDSFNLQIFNQTFITNSYLDIPFAFL